MKEIFVEEDKPILIYFKKAEPKTHKMVIPKTFVEEHGNEFYMEVYRDKLVIKPKKEGK